jgi:uncharacterized protein (DUF2141 family)
MQANRKNGRCGPACRYRTRAAWARLLAGISLLYLLFLSGCTQDSAPKDPDLAALPIVRPIPAKPNPPAPEPAHLSQESPPNQEPPVQQEPTPSQEPPPSQAVGASDRKPNPQTLIVEVHGLQNQSGRCRLALYQNAKGFNQPKSAWAKQTLDLPEQGPVIWRVELEDTPESQTLLDSPTRWAVSAHHDQNNNDQLDKNAFGIPTEPYGFSNNPKRGFGPPKFDEACFSIGSGEPQEALRIEIRVQ